jgi:hypothetical protein
VFKKKQHEREQLVSDGEGLHVTYKYCGTKAQEYRVLAGSTSLHQLGEGVDDDSDGDDGDGDHDDRKGQGEKPRRVVKVRGGSKR